MKLPGIVKSCIRYCSYSNGSLTRIRLLNTSSAETSATMAVGIMRLFSRFSSRNVLSCSGLDYAQPRYSSELQKERRMKSNLTLAIGCHEMYVSTRSSINIVD
jgi:hypothetical protein